MGESHKESVLSALPIYYAAANTSFADDFKGGCKDIVNSFKDTRIWFALGLNDIMARYRGSVLGPFWITLTTAVFVMGIGFLYAGLMKVSIERYLPWMTTGLVVWGLISQTVLEGGDAFISAANILRQTDMPIPLFVWRVVWRNLITFVHQAPVLIAVGLKFHYLFQMNLIEASAGLILIVVNISWAALFVAMVSARFRDFQQVLASLTQLLFFLSPVLWIPNQMKGLGGKMMMLNPVVHMLNVLRGPLLGQGFSGFSAMFLIGTALMGWIITLILFTKVRRRIIHYI